MFYFFWIRFSLPYHLPRKHHQINANSHPQSAQISPSNVTSTKQTLIESPNNTTLPNSNSTLTAELTSDNNSTNVKVQNDTTTIFQSDIKLEHRINESKSSEVNSNHQHNHPETNDNEVSHIVDIHHAHMPQQRKPVKKTKYQDFDLSLNQDEGLFGSIMKVLGLNQCPITPPDLTGPIKPDLEYEELEAVEKRFADSIRPGGRFQPKECRATSRVALVIPYRDRKQHIPIFLKNIHALLMKQQIDYGIFIVEQSPDGSFNRAKLMNVGFTEALKSNEFDCFIFHDIDLIPLDDRNLYTCPDQPRHMSVAVDSLGFKWVNDPVQFLIAYMHWDFD